ncbi:helix-turn-helix transcriptional regulator [Brevibacterium oceani]|uniref:helix-turn-helix transcriptional regulator n=1 Tax=Brevibacterium oceani TaxID=358099 RepID=UPI002159E108|nr:WYL domain-containing protein [Brevibacterium oceani]
MSAEPVMGRPQRLLSLIVTLQGHRQTTAAELAERFGVSKRTILRDIVALAEADVPVVADRGRYGGISLMPGAEIDVNRLTNSEAEVLALLGVDGESARQLGLEDSAHSARDKLSSRRIRPPRRGEEPSLPLSEVIVVDGSDWFAPDEPIDFSDFLVDLRRGSRLRIDYRSSGQTVSRFLVVDPYGLYSRSGRWYLIADVDEEPRMFAMTRLRGWEALEEPRRLRPGTALSTVAADLAERLERRRDVVVTAHLDARTEDLARRILGSRLLDVSPAEGPDSVIITVGYEELGGVRQLVQFTDHIEIIAPIEARALVRERAQNLLDRH